MEGTIPPEEREGGGEVADIPPGGLRNSEMNLARDQGAQGMHRMRELFLGCYVRQCFGANFVAILDAELV